MMICGGRAEILHPMNCTKFRNVLGISRSMDSRLLKDFALL